MNITGMLKQRVIIFPEKIETKEKRIQAIPSANASRGRANFWLIIISIPILSFLILSFLLEPVYSADSNPPIVIETTGQGNSSKPKESEILNVFSSQTVNLSLDVYGFSQNKIEIRADLFQISKRLAIPVRKDISVASGLDISGGARHNLVFTLEVPDVERTTSFLLQYRALFPPDEKWFVAGSANIKVYPSNILEPIQLFSRKNSIFLWDKCEKLTNFLKTQKIEFKELEKEIPKNSKNPCVILTEFMSVEKFHLPDNLSPDQVMIVFYPEFKGLPRIITRPVGGSSLIEIKMPILEKHSSDPETHETLLEIFNIAFDILNINKK